MPIGNSVKSLTNNIINYNPDKIKEDATILSDQLYNKIKPLNDPTFSNKNFDVTPNDNRNMLGNPNNNRSLFNLP